MSRWRRSNDVPQDWDSPPALAKGGIDERDEDDFENWDDFVPPPPIPKPKPRQDLLSARPAQTPQPKPQQQQPQLEQQHQQQPCPQQQQQQQPCPQQPQLKQQLQQPRPLQLQRPQPQPSPQQQPKAKPQPKVIPMCTQTLECRKVDPPPRGAKPFQVNENVAAVLEHAQALSSTDLDSLIKELFKSPKLSFDQRKGILYFLNAHLKRNHFTVNHFTIQGGSEESSGRPRTVDPNPQISEAQPNLMSSSELSQSQKNTHVSRQGSQWSGVALFGQQRRADPLYIPHPYESATRASQVPLICRGDLIAKADIFMLDCEKLELEKQLDGKHPQVAGDVAVCTPDGVLVFWAYIRRENICKFNTKMTGLTKEKIETGFDIKVIHAMFDSFFEGKKFYGINIGLDFEGLGYKVKRHENTILRERGHCVLTDSSIKLKDVGQFFYDDKNQPIALAYLSEHFRGENVHSGVHSSIKDARMTATVYKKMLQLRAMGYTRFECPEFTKIRGNPLYNPRLRNPWKSEKCTCSKL